VNLQLEAEFARRSVGDIRRAHRRADAVVDHVHLIGYVLAVDINFPWPGLGRVGNSRIEKGVCAALVTWRYLYLTDRKHFMIISGGVNVYPQEIENLLVTHSRIADAAVIGVPDPDFGEKVSAIIQPIDMRDATTAFAEEIKSWLRQSLSGVKVPKRIEFRGDVPRLPTGKMAKHILREEYSRRGDV
jgi:acyl-CoA synthetase (AMP-forming)/AMP-acid ligase II